MEKKIFLRKVTDNDLEDVFKLSNQDYVREHSINKNKIKWDDHMIWFNGVINDPNNLFYVVSDDLDRFLGQIRYKIKNNAATVSISLSHLLIGKGYSKDLLLQSINKLFCERKEVKEIIAYVSKKNTPSLKLFKKAGFSLHQEEGDLLKFIYYGEE